MARVCYSPGLLSVMDGLSYEPGLKGLDNGEGLLVLMCKSDEGRNSLVG